MCLLFLFVNVQPDCVAVQLFSAGALCTCCFCLLMFIVIVLPCSHFQQVLYVPVVSFG